MRVSSSVSASTSTSSTTTTTPTAVMLSPVGPATCEPTHSATSGAPVQMLTVTNAAAAASARRFTINTSSHSPPD